MGDLEGILEAIRTAAEKSDEEVRVADRPSPIWLKRLEANVTSLLEDHYE